MIPVINPITSIVAYGVGVFFEFQPAASRAPTSWVITGLPEGMNANETTGRISGAPEQLGIYDVTLVAQNASGDSAEVVAPFVVGVGYGLQEPVILMDFALESASLASVGAVKDALLFGKTGDKLLIALGFTRAGALVPQTIESIFLALKEFEPESLVDLTTGAFRIAWTSEGPRYIFLVDLTTEAAASMLGIQSGYEDDNDTRVDFVAQIRVIFSAVVLSGEDPSSLPRTSQNFKFRISRSLQ